MALTLWRTGDGVEALKVEDWLMHLYKAVGGSDQAAAVEKGRDALPMVTSPASSSNAIEGGGGYVVRTRV